MRFAWHGNASCTLEVAGCRITVDPWFSQADAGYGDWYVPNPRAPGREAFLQEFRPHYVILTHGHWDHLDPEAIKWIDAGLRPRYIATPEVVEALGRLCAVPAGRCLPLQPGQRADLPEGIGLRTWAGDHWFTGPAGDLAARKLAHRYGAMPAGGAMLQFALETPAGRVYISGDTLLGAVPRLGGCRLAVVSMGTWCPHPTTGVPSEPVITLGQIPFLLERLEPQVLAPVHWDFPLWRAPFDCAAAAASTATHRPGTHVLLPPANTWVEVPG